MRAVVQRADRAEVTVDDEVVASIGPGLLVLVGAVNSDTFADVSALATKVVTMRIFSDLDEKMNLSVADIGGSVLVVSQFTLLADIRRGRRPSFTAAAHPEHARSLIDHLVEEIGDRGVGVETGRFGASMDVSLVNSGPVTIIVDVVDGRVG
jgi:D-tyrosyl-tRNA(Tyr) deacylase